MKIILEKDVEGLGREGEVVEVTDGYARNFLLPRKLAVLATKGSLKQLGQKRKILEKREAALKEEAEKVAASLEGETLELTAKAGKAQRLYGSITAKDIAQALNEQKKIKLDKKIIVLENPIKLVGEHLVAVKLHSEVEAKVLVKVCPQEEPEKKQAPEEKAKEKAKVKESAKKKETKETKEEKEEVSGQTSQESKGGEDEK